MRVPEFNELRASAATINNGRHVWQDMHHGNVFRYETGVVFTHLNDIDNRRVYIEYNLSVFKPGDDHTPKSVYNPETGERVPWAHVTTDRTGTKSTPTLALDMDTGRVIAVGLHTGWYDREKRVDGSRLFTNDRVPPHVSAFGGWIWWPEYGHIMGADTLRTTAPIPEKKFYVEIDKTLEAMERLAPSNIDADSTLAQEYWHRGEREARALLDGAAHRVGATVETVTTELLEITRHPKYARYSNREYINKREVIRYEYLTVKEGGEQ